MEDKKKYQILDSEKMKICKSDNYNLVFDKTTGFSARWGKTKEDDPFFSPIGPEILDLEVTTICHGIRNREDNTQHLCQFCYKSNTPNGRNMSFDTFKTIFDKMPKILTQIAFGADSQAKSNPNLFAMMEYARERGVIPNITVSDICERTADKLAGTCGAVACSRYSDYNICYDCVKMLTDRGMKQVNIHIMVSEETYDDIMKTMMHQISDPRLKNLNAIVLLSLKCKGRGKSFTQLSQDKFDSMIDYAFKNNTPIGFDSCSYPKFIQALENLKIDDKRKAQMKILAEPCESLGFFSSYINVDGIYFPCSFMEGEGDWIEGIDVVHCKDFLKDIWYSEKLSLWRNKIIEQRKSGKFDCPYFKV